MCQDTAPEGAVGRNVAIQRKLAGLTQEQLASRAHVSRSLVSQVEQGALPASTAFTSAVAHALGVDVTALTGEPYGHPITDPTAEHAGIAALRMAVAAFRYTGARMRRGDYAAVLRSVERGHALLDGERAPAVGAIRTVLHLRQGRVHARLGARDRADEHINEARRLVAAGVPDPPYYSVNANPANIDMHYVEVPVELLDGATAVSRVEQVQLPSDTHPSLAGHHWAGVARAWTLYGDRTKALDALNQARRIAPQQTRYHSSVRETVHLLAEHDRRANDSLAGFARWAGITL